MGEWPLDLLDVPALRATGWRPVPFRHFVVKIHNRCNLACTYCYMYELADQSWRARPRVMSASVVTALTRRVAEHVSKHGLPWIDVVLHGGEPLLAGIEMIERTSAQIRAAVPASCTVRVQIQTNAVLLEEETLARLVRQGIRVGVSLDGAAATNDRRRRFADGRGSYDKVAAALRLLGRPQYREAFAGILCTIDAESDPVRTYEALLEFSPPNVDFLLPHGNWSSPPPHREATFTPGLYAQWLLDLFERWYRAPRRETGIRFFDEIIHLVLGGRSTSESIGLSPVGVIVTDTDGSIEQVDSLRSAYDGAAAAGFDVVRNSFDEVLAHPGVAARQIGSRALAERCRTCPVMKVCGGGHYPHRYRAGAGYRNPSVYCADLKVAIEHIRQVLLDDVQALREANTT
ncbi:hypothetical protein GCM10027456_68740 [Kineosporia babensis]